ncbi:MAG: transporter [Pseudomonadota bacterium]
MPQLRALPAILALTLAPGQTWAQAGGTAELAQQLSNPVADLISVPLQFNYDDGIGPNDGSRWTTNIQPVIPFSIGENWNVISRTILPIISQEDVTASGAHESGTGDIVQSLFFSPKEPTANGWVWGAGPVFLLPTGSDDFSADQWGIGPTAVALRVQGPWTYGALANHIWGFDANDGEDEINVSFLQPFAAYTTANAWTFTVNSESTYDWNTETWSVPVNAIVSKLVSLGTQPVSLAAGVRYWAEAPAGGPDDVGFRLAVTFLFPR